MRRRTTGITLRSWASTEKVARLGQVAPNARSGLTSLTGIRPRPEVALVEARARAGVAGGADLVDAHEQRVAVAVERHRLDALVVAARVPLAPVLLTAARPEGHAALGEGPAQRLVVHPAEHQHLAAVVLLDDRGDQAMGVALEAVGDGGVEGGRGNHPAIVP